MAPASLDLWREDLLAVPTDRKVALAVELEAAVRAADSRITGIESCDYADSADEMKTYWRERLTELKTKLETGELAA